MKKLLSVFYILIIFAFIISGCVSTEYSDEAEEPVLTETEPVIEPALEPEPEPVVEEPEEFVVTEELYITTFEDIRKIIGNLNSIITSKDYNTWLNYLTDDYIEYYSDEIVLNEFTELYKQRGYSYRINDLEDYFLYLVVISRANAVLDEIIFIDSTHVKALTEIKGKLSVLYYLEKTENGWKIGLKPEN